MCLVGGGEAETSNRIDALVRGVLNGLFVGHFMGRL
jgi:hypothetical protein